MKNLTIYIAIAVLVIAAIVAFVILNNNDTEVAPEEGPVVAVVNGQDITREEFNRRLDDAKKAITAQGQAAQLDDPEIVAQLENQVFDQAIIDTLIFQEIAKAGIAVGVDGIFVETHPDPSKALSDGANMLKLSLLDEFDWMTVSEYISRDESIGRHK